MNENAKKYALENYEQGVEFLDKKFDYEVAMKYFDQAIKFNPNLGKAYYKLGQIWTYLEKYKDAVDNYSKAISSKIDCEDNFVYFSYIYRGGIYSGLEYNNEGYIQENLQDLSKAIEDFSAAIEIDPNFYVAYLDRGKCYQELKQYEKAIEDFTKVIKMKSNWSVGYYYRGKCYEALGIFDEAGIDLKKNKMLCEIEKNNLESSYSQIVLKSLKL